jgi:hypothetical protein
MFLLQSWNVGETPHLDNMTFDLVTWAKMLGNAIKEGREFQIYEVNGNELRLIYPEPNPATQLNLSADEAEPKC